MATQQWILGLDVGTTGCKAVLFHPSVGIAGVASVPHTMDNPRPGWWEQEADVWWEGTRQAIRAVLAEAGVTGDHVAAVGVSGFGANMVPLDAAGRPLRKAILYGIDTRAHGEIAELERLLGEETIAANGNPLSSQAVGPKLVWLRNNEPAVFSRTRQIVGTAGYLFLRLTGRARLDYGEASFYGPFYRVSHQQWDAAALAAVGIDENLFPPMGWASSPWGAVSGEAARQTGLRAGTPVGGGTIDHFAERVVTGHIKPGALLLTYGSTLGIAVIANRRRVDRRVLCNDFCFPGAYSVGGATATAGSMLQWFRRELGIPSDGVAHDRGADDGDHYARMTSAAARVPPGSEGLIVLPYFSGERSPVWDPRARGLIIGVTIAHTQAHLYRALLESIAYSARHHMDVFEEMGFTVTEAVASGGGTRDGLWLQVMSDVTRLPQIVCRLPHTAALGAGLLAAQGAGVVSDLQQAVASLVKDDLASVYPAPGVETEYDDYYGVYRSLYPLVRSSMARLSDLAEAVPGPALGDPAEPGMKAEADAAAKGADPFA